MAAVQIDEAELANLRRLQDVYSAMMGNTEARDLLLTANKKINPNVVTEKDRLDAAIKPFEERTAKTADELTALRKALDDEKADRAREREESKLRQTWDSQKAKLRNAGYMDGAIDAIEKIAFEKGIADMEIAAAVYDKAHPPSAPVHGGTWSYFEPPAADSEDGKFFDELYKSHGENTAALNKQIAGILAEVRGQRAA